MFDITLEFCGGPDLETQWLAFVQTGQAGALADGVALPSVYGATAKEALLRLSEEMGEIGALFENEYK